MSESHTISQLLDYMEENSQHAPDAGECDCMYCNTYTTIVNLSKRMDAK